MRQAACSCIDLIGLYVNLSTVTFHSLIHHCHAALHCIAGRSGIGEYLDNSPCCAVLGGVYGEGEERVLLGDGLMHVLMSER